MIRKHLGEQGVEAMVCEHFAKGSKGATNLAKSMVKLIDTKPGNPATLSVPVHGNKDLKKGLQADLMKQAELTEDDL